MTKGGPGRSERLGIFGGTFDPIHVGHLVVASEALHAMSLDRVVFVPAGRPWQKSTHADPEDRFMMVTLAAAGHPRFTVSRLELDRRGSTYTVDTLRELKQFFQAELYFIAGADTVAELGTWHRVGDLKDLADVIAVNRAGHSAPIVPQEGWPPVHEMEIPEIGVSSTMIRRRISAGQPIDYLVPAEAARYIATRGLYMHMHVGGLDA